MRLLIIRHGDPDYSIDSLTKKGFREAHLLADRLCREHIDEVYCSTLGRAKDTAKETLSRLNMTAQYVEWLREVNYMKVKNPENPDEIKSMWDFMPHFFSKQDIMHSKDEWVNADILKNTEIPKLYKKVTDSLDDVLRKNGYERDGGMYRTEKGNHRTIAFFCHLGAESVLMSHLLNCSPFVFLQYFFVPPTSVTTLFTEERIKGEVSFRAHSVGDISHLYAGNEPPSFSGRFCECFEDDTRH